jgi:alpha/beta superfamily hydrolase
LSVQMPVLAADARGDQYPPLYAQAAERLRAAVAFLRGSGQIRIAGADHFFSGQETQLVGQVRQFLDQKLR